MFNWFEPEACPIGIDIGTHSVKLMQFRRRKDELLLQAACSVDLESVPQTGNQTQHLAAVIRTALEGGEFVGRRCVLSLPATAVHTKSVRLPQMPEADLAQAVKWEAKDRFSFDLAEGRLVYFLAGEVRRGTEVKDEVLLFAAPEDVLRSHLEAIRSVKLQADAIDLAPCALVRSLRRAMPVQREAAGAVLDVGSGGSQFVIYLDDRIVFYKYIDIGGRKINEAIAAKLGVSLQEATQIRLQLASPAGKEEGDESAPLAQAVYDAMRPPVEELARELDMCMRYYVVSFRGARSDTVSLSGRQALCPRLQEGLSAGLGMRVEPAQPLRSVGELGDKARPDRSSEWAVAAGLSLYPVDEAAADRKEVAA